MKHSAKLDLWLCITLLAFLAVVMVGCASLVKPESFDQQLAYAMGQTTAVRQTAADLVERGRMSADEGQNVLDLTDNMRLMVETARSVYPENPDQAMVQLRAVQNILLQIEISLRARQ